MEDVDKQFSGCLLEQLPFVNALSWWCWYVLLSYNGLYYFNATWRVLCQPTRKCLFHLDTYQWRLAIRYGLGASARREIFSLCLDGLLFQKTKPNLSIKRNFLVSVQNSVLSSENLTKTYLPSARLTGISLIPIFRAEIPKRNFWWARQSPLG